MKYNDLNIGFYLPDLSDAESSGPLTFFNFIKRAFFEYQNTKNHKFIIICENPKDLGDFSNENIKVLEMPKVESKTSLTFQELLRFRIGTWLHKIAKFFFLSIQINPLGQTESDLNPHQYFRKKNIEDLIDENSIDLMVYANQFELPSTNRPYIWILWDMACKTISFFYQMEQSKKYLEKVDLAAHNAFKVITGSKEGSKEINKFLSFPEERIRTIPFPVPNEIIMAKPIQPSIHSELGNYIYYPALLTPFKNHSVILEAIKILLDKNISINLVLTGFNKGNLKHILNQSNELGIEKQIHYLGVVSLGELSWLYQNAEALVYSSLIGPNNFPPIEAMALGTPCIVSNIQGHLDQLEDNALFFDPLDPNSLADNLIALLTNPSVKENLCIKGKSFTKELTPTKYLEEIISCADEFLPYRNNWSDFNNN
jgi:glycosyltransferase involved in cell wall biosynthesis